MVKIVTQERACSTVQPDDCQDLLYLAGIAFPKVLVSFDPNSKVLLRSFKADKCIVAWNMASHLSSSSIKVQISYILQMTLGF